MDDQVPLRDFGSAPNDLNTAYQQAPRRTTGYSKIGEETSALEVPERVTDASSRNPHHWSLVRRSLVLLVVLWCTSLGDFGSRISGAFKASVAK